MRLDQISFMRLSLMIIWLRMVLTMRMGKVMAKIFAASTILSSFILNRSALAFQVARHRPIALLSQIWRCFMDGGCIPYQNKNKSD
jgi:hypothetical protein